MRLLRVLVVAAFAALLAQPSAAQEGRPFHDAWFWGVKGGIVSYSADGTDNNGAPVVGVDWLITRTRGGLYVSADQSFIHTYGFYREPFVTGDPYVRLDNERRYSIVGMIFPMQSPSFHPYLGVGGSLHQVVSAQIDAGITLPALRQAAQDSLQANKVAISPMVVIGGQQRLLGFSVFAQGTGTWLPKGYYMRHESPKRGIALSIEGGIRYNIGSSIDRDR
jgi:hypothetical protein